MPEHVASKFKEICNFQDGRATYPVTTQDSFSAVQANFENISSSNPEKKGGSGIDVEAAKKAVLKDAEFTYTDKDVRLYALGVYDDVITVLEVLNEPISRSYMRMTRNSLHYLRLV